MSRSFKKHAWTKDPNNKFMKRYANKIVRRAKDVPSGGAYKKLFCSYDISDFKWLWTRQGAIREYKEDVYPEYLRNRRFKTLEEYLKYWEKCVRRK